MSKKRHDATKISHQQKVIARMEDVIKGLKQLVVDQNEKAMFWKGRWEKEKAKNGRIFTDSDSVSPDSDECTYIGGPAGESTFGDAGPVGEDESGVSEEGSGQLENPLCSREEAVGSPPGDIDLSPEDAAPDSGGAGSEPTGCVAP